MILNNCFFVIDAGNTELVISLIKNYKIFRTKRISTQIFLKNKKIFSYFKLNNILKNKKKINCIISSVVPNINLYIKTECFKSLNSYPHFITHNKTKLNIKLNFKKKSQVGADRIVNTVAVKHLYKYPAVVIDFGTATTFDIINNNGDYEGGLITPGINLSLKNLNKKTSKLPLVKFKKIKGVIGKNTKDAIQKGVYLSYIGLTSFIINKIQKNFKKKLFCISTGGLSHIISKNIKSINVINKDLTILGLIEIYKLNNNG